MTEPAIQVSPVQLTREQLDAVIMHRTADLLTVQAVVPGVVCLYRTHLSLGIAPDERTLVERLGQVDARDAHAWLVNLGASDSSIWEYNIFELSGWLAHQLNYVRDDVPHPVNIPGYRSFFESVRSWRPAPSPDEITADELDMAFEEMFFDLGNLPELGLAG